MSIKIYTGYRFKKKHLAEFTTDLRDKHYRFVLNLVRKRAMARNRATESEKLTWDERVRLTLKEALEAAQSSDRMAWADIECSWGIWSPPGSYCLTIPYGDHYVCGDRLEFLPDWLEPYGYWDNTDRPDSISPAEWRRRKKAWKFYTQPGGQNYRMTLDVIDLSKGICSYHHSSLTVDLERMGEPDAIEMLGAQAGD